MAKRKVIKFVFQGNRKVKNGEWFGDELFQLWDKDIESNYDQNVYHRIETEEEAPRWRAEDGDAYYGVTSYYKIVKGFEQNSPLDDMMYDSGNYFQTEEQAQEYIDHCKKFFENN